MLTEGFHHYCIKEAEDNQYFYETEYHVMRYNRLPSLLPVMLRCSDREKRLLYEVTGMKSLADLSEEGKYSLSVCRTVLRGISDVLLQMEEFLLEPACLSYEPEDIYLDTDRIRWIYGPVRADDITEKMMDLLSWLLTKVDYEDTAAVNLMYRVFWCVRKQGVRRSLIEDCLDEEEKLPYADTERKGDSYEDFFEGEDEGKEEERRDDCNAERGEKRRRLLLAMGGILTATEGLFALWLLILSFRIGYYYPSWRILAAVWLIFGAASASLLYFFLTGNRQSADKMQSAGKMEEDTYNKDRTEEPVHIIQSTSGWTQTEPGQVPDAIRRLYDVNPADYQGGDSDATTVLSAIRQKMPYLKSLDSGELYMIDTVPFYIGSDRTGNRMVISDSSVSRRHAVIIRNAGEESYLVRDLGSTNGTWVRGIRVISGESETLDYGSVVCFAQKKYRFLWNKPPADML